MSTQDNGLHKGAHSVVVNPLAREISTMVQILVSARWEKKISPRISKKKIMAYSQTVHAFQ
jgi:hypothetical protein